ncbi:hypothetical protein [Ensifer sp. LBL]|uniref:hypothetical protein n=1 Tax=Ensifer sp. LBL TaxID=2991056 RepID=UPI003D1C260A
MSPKGWREGMRGGLGIDVLLAVEQGGVSTERNQGNMGRMPTLSNEAEEIHRMCETFNQIHTGGSTSSVLAGLIGVDPESPEYFSFISAIRLRFRRFLEVAQNAIANERHRGHLEAAVAQLQSFTDQRFWQSHWHEAKKHAFQDKHLLTIDMAGGSLANVAPVVVLSDEERREHIQNLNLALSAVEGSADYAAQLVAQAIRTSIKMIELFDVYGSAAIGEKLFETHAIIKQAATIAPKERKSSYGRAAAIVGVVLAGVIAADDAFSAVENFYTRAKTAVEMLMLASPPAQKLLPSPTADKEADNDDTPSGEGDEQLRL